MWLHAGVFSEITEAFVFGLRGLGFIVDVTSRPSGKQSQIIVIAGFELSDADASGLPSSTVVYNAEPVQQIEPFPKYADLLKRHTIWDYNKDNAARVARLLKKPVYYVPIGFVDEWRRIKVAAEEDIDVLFYGRSSPRRESVLARLVQAGLVVKHLRETAIARAGGGRSMRVGLILCALSGHGRVFFTQFP